MIGDRICPLWDYETTAKLNGYQNSGKMHPFTCGIDSSHGSLVALPDGWICLNDNCDYTQEWAHSFMADGSFE